MSKKKASKSKAKRPPTQKKLEKFKHLKEANSFYLLIILIVALIGFNTVLVFVNSRVIEGAYLNVKHKIVKNTNHIKKPKNVKGIYITAYTAGTKRLDELIAFAKRNELNSLVIDIKAGDGQPAFFYERESLKKYNYTREFYNVEEVIKKVHDNNLYAIARTFVFQDPYMVRKEPQFALKRKGGGVWRDYKGVTWLDPTLQEVWKYNADLAREAYDRGFDEIQFDYIRFPSDGNLKAIEYSNWDGTTPKEIEIEKFFAYLSRIMRNRKIPISADLFGLTCCYEDYDLGIGQKLDRALPYFDFISPMMYPSHYSDGFIGYANPASHPYGVIKYSMDESNKIRDKMASSTDQKLGELRPWIQDFDIGDIYDTHKVKEQIRAIEETGGEGFLIWNARNVYSNIK